MTAAEKVTKACQIVYRHRAAIEARFKGMQLGEYSAALNDGYARYEIGIRDTGLLFNQMAKEAARDELEQAGLKGVL